MWDLQVASPFGRISKRYIFTFVMALVVTCFAYIFVAAPPVHAADAEWSGAAIRYDGNLYTKAADGKDNDPRSISKGSLVYANISTPAATGSTANPPQKASFLYFPPSADITTAVSAQYIIFDYVPPSTYANPSSVQTIAITNQPSASGGTSCDSKMTWGLGWMICPATRMLAGAMDTLFTVLSSFLTVQPAQTGQTDTLYLAWSFMRNFANIVFAGGFLVIIYSQLTSMGLSSYGVKKILPRLIIAAILVNVSYWVCAIAIDLSNILGYAIQDLFIGLRTGLMGAEGGGGWSTGSWESITGFILSAGTVGVVGGIAAGSLITGVGAGALYLLLPILVGVLMAVLVALLVMAARQAIIIVLVIVSPLAFVAYLLPNTEKYFEKWRSLFTTMLILFPMFSVIFGGSQLAGLAIIKNANSINLVLLGLAVQVAPVVITPLLVKFSGSLVGRIAGIVNNPNKGLIDRTRKFADERRGQHEARRKALADPNTWKGRRIINSDTKRRAREGWQKTNESLSEARFAQTREYSNMQQANMKAAELKDLGDTNSQLRYNTAKRTEASSQQLDLDIRASKLHLDVSKAAVDANWEELKAGNATNTVLPAGLAVSGIASYMHERNNMATALANATTQNQVEGRRTHEAQEIQKDNFAEALMKSTTLRKEAGGIAGRAGADSALAAAITVKRKTYSDNSAEKLQLIKHFNLDSRDRQDLAIGSDVTAVDEHNNTYTFRADDDHTRDAAIEEQLKTGSFGDIQQIIEESAQTVNGRAGKTHAYRTTIAGAITSNGLQNKAVYFGSKAIDDVAQGTFNVKQSAIYNIVKGKIKDEVLAGMDADAVRTMLDPTLEASVSAADLPDFRANRLAMQHAAWRIMNNDLMSRSANQSTRKALDDFAIEPPTTP